MKYRNGYALPLTLAAIIVISLVAAMAAQQVSRSTRTITELFDRMRSQTEMASAEQTLIYQLLTEPMTQQGVATGLQSDLTSLVLGDFSSVSPDSVIKPNGRPYRVGDYPVIVRLYDDQAFLNIASLDPGYLSDVLRLFGVPGEQHARMIAALRDYEDDDDLETLGGAEASDYAQQGLPPNTPVRDELEVCAVLHWGDSNICQDTNRLLMTTRIRTSDTLNPALTSEAMLDLMAPNALREEISDLFYRYSEGQYTSYAVIGQERFDFIRDPLSTFSSPGPFLVTVVHTLDGAQAVRTVIELTPNSLNSPFVVHSKYAIGSEYSQRVLRTESIDDVAPLPQSPALTSERPTRTDASRRTP